MKRDYLNLESSADAHLEAKAEKHRRPQQLNAAAVAANQLCNVEGVLKINDECEDKSSSLKLETGSDSSVQVEKATLDDDGLVTSDHQPPPEKRP